MRNAIISGGMGDIGRAISKKLARDGFSLTILTSAAVTSEHNTFINSLEGTGHTVHTCNITDKIAVQALIAEREKEIEHFDMCIHAAVSPLVRAYASTIQEADFKAQFDVGLFGGFNLFQSVIPSMKREGSGHLVGITTKALYSETATKMAGYTCAKFALQGLLRELSKELNEHGIRVNAVAPGLVPTKLHADIPSRAFDFIAHKEPEGKLTTPEEVADVVSYVCSDAAAEVTGMSYPVHGGEPVKF